MSCSITPALGRAADPAGLPTGSDQASDTISFTGDYTLKASKSLEFADGGPAFIMSVDPGESGRLIIAGSATVTNQADNRAVFGVEAGGDQTTSLIWVQDGGVLNIDNTGAQGASYGVRFGVGDNHVTNDGTFSVSDPNEATGVDGGASDVLAFINSGTFTVQSDDGRATGVSNHYDTHVTNSGVMDISGGASVGVTFDNGGSFDNSGVLRVTGDNAQGFTAIGEVDFSNTGKIIVAGVTLALGVEIDVPHAFTNAGTIVATASDPDGVATALELTSHFDAHLTLDNQGSISGDIAIQMDDSAGFGGMEALTNSGKITGLVSLGYGDDAILNTGKMMGEIDLGAGDDQFDGAHGKHVGAIIGGEGYDTISGGAGAESIWGDGLEAGSQDRADILSGGKGADSLHGGAGNDTLTGGAGADVLEGGADKDTFVFLKAADSKAGHGDLIVDLDATDRIDLSAIDADTTTAGNQAFVLVDHLDGHAGQLALSYDAGSNTSTIAADVNGDGVADMEIFVTGDVTGFSHFAL